MDHDHTHKHPQSQADHTAHHHMHDHGHDHDASPAPAAGQAIDPVCGMQVPVTAGARTRQYGDQTFYFCSDGCQSRFDADPWFYALGKAATAEKQAPAGTQWTCPMHPQIIRDAPGACPICGMALEPVIPSDEPSAELVDFTRRLWVSVAAAVHLGVAKSGAINKVDLDGPSLSQFNPVVGGVIFNESEISITDAPGLGIIEVRGLEMIKP